MKYYFQCPKCGNDEQFFVPTETGGFDNQYSVGGMLMFAAYRSRRVQCARCMHLFPQPGLPSSSLSKFAVWIGVLTALLFLISFLLSEMPDLANTLPQIPVIEEIIAAQPRIIAWLLLSLFSTILLSCLAASAVSNALFRKAFSKTHLTKASRPPVPNTSHASSGIEAGIE